MYLSKKTFPIYISVSFLLVFILSVPAQKTQEISIDSLFNEINTQSNNKQKVNKLFRLYKKAYKQREYRADILEEALDVSKKIFYIDGIAKAYDYKGYLERKKNNYQKSIEYHKRALSFFEQSKDTFSKIKCLNNLGVSFRKLNDEKEAYNYYLRALELAKKISNQRSIAIAYNGIGNIYINTEEYDKALFFFKKALQVELLNENIKGQEYDLANIGETFIYKKKLDSAEVYLKKSLELAQLQMKENDLGIEYNLLGLLYQKKENFGKSIVYYKKTIPLVEKYNIQRYVANSYINLGISQLQIGQIKESVKNINKGLQIAKEIGSKENIFLGYNALVEYYSKTNNYKKALNAHKLSKKFHDSIVNINAKNSIISAQIIYETKEKDNKIKQLAFEKEKEKKISKKRFWWLIGISLTSLFILLNMFFVFRLRRKNRDLELAQKNSEIQNYMLQIKEMKNSLNNRENKDIDWTEKLHKYDLTKREIDVLKLISAGYNNEQIAEKIFISKNTVKSHIKNIYLKLDVRNRIQAINKIEKN